MGGYNPIRWPCAKWGCFNVKCRPKIEIFSECFPGSINFGDVDGLVERKGYLCFLEWKGAGGSLKDGQRILFENITRKKGDVAFVVDGDPETMEVWGFSIYWDGIVYQSIDGEGMERLKLYLTNWVKWVDGSRLPLHPEREG